MRKIFRLIVPFLLFGILIVLFFGIRTKLKVRQQVEQAIAHLPEVNYLTLNNTTQKLRNAENRTVIVVFFHSDCDFCQAEARSLLENRETLNKGSVYLFSTEPLNNIKKFKEAHFPGNTDFTFGQIDALTSSEVFGVSSFPYTLIYDNTNRLIKTFKGMVKPEAIAKYIDDHAPLL